MILLHLFTTVVIDPEILYESFRRNVEIAHCRIYTVCKCALYCKQTHELVNITGLPPEAEFMNKQHFVEVSVHSLESSHI
jgi:hypothetical protein